MNSQNKNLDLIAKYEESHAVESYLSEGWHVWPLLRNALAWNFFPETDQLIVLDNVARKFINVLKRLYSKIIYFSLYRFQYFEHLDSIFIVSSSRRVNIDGVSHEIYSDPMVELCLKHGINCRAWEISAGSKNQRNKSFKFGGRMKNETRIRKSEKLESEVPEWFDDYQILASEIIGRKIHWQEVCQLINITTTRAKIFQDWFQLSKPKIIFSVCWFDAINMAAIMAAKKLSIVSVEIQHGIQGINHPGYSLWLKFPAGGYEVYPDIFWEWGVRSVEEIRKYNPILSSKSLAIEGGNLWLNSWKEKKISSVRNKVDEDCLTILVVLQLDPPTALIKAINECEMRWRWIVRFHPTRSKKLRALDAKKFIGKNIFFEYPEEVSAYESIINSDCIVTEGSAVALEALGVGSNVVILGDTFLGKLAQQAYEYYIASGDMIVSSDNNIIKSIIRSVKSVSSINMSREFADEASSHIALNRIFEMAHNLKGKIFDKNSFSL
ncbi:hypothetical protein [Polynucleobacter sp. AP-Kaivos-20-H2]|uniref:hypothetical protein n=1 Tax=Polynucleobacter sp. AP-Kaivos-20-H2 TaxID=2689104 RepID=UPI001C0A951D|nr:hypothetical protein [Polynucleobacter sp. AP-Kaivos-20-H2]MBU3604128.1 hypothetical protein [Polynucleobacter sp. AP-Kaivos-20-H2]